MKFIAKYIHAIGLLMLTGFVAVAATLYFDLPARAAKRPAAPAVVSDRHAGCNHAQASSSAETEKPAATDCGHSGGCCSAKTGQPLLPSAAAGGISSPSRSAPILDPS